MLPISAVLQTPAEPSSLFTLGDAVTEYIGFLASFGVFGALGFRYAVLRGPHAAPAFAGGLGGGGEAGVYARAERGAARIGIVGALLLLVNIAFSLWQRAAERHLTLADAAARGGARLLAVVVFALLFLVVFTAALRGARGAWTAAAILGVAFVLRDVVSLRWKAEVNPLHETAASLWIGTLFVVVAAGLPAVLYAASPRERRGPLVADMIGRFSPLALGAAALLLLTGLTTAWLHLKRLSALWTTPYGLTLIAKLCVVAIVAALGAWNWRRMRPRLGGEEAAHAIRRTASTELAVAAVVLALTAVLVSLPSPR
ncbi:MAG TPA: CopD family protein [Gemmatimonadaceae bacterium]